MKSMKQILVENSIKKIKKQIERERTPQRPPINNPLIALAMLPNEKVQSLIVEGTQSTYTPIPRGDGRPLAMLRRIEREQRRSAAWTGLRA